MTRDDLEAIEAALGVALPAIYVETMLAYPIPAYSGDDSETELWDSSQALIDENLSLRSGSYGIQKWPDHFFCLGGSSGCVHAIDLRSPDAPVWWVENRHLNSVDTYQVAPSFSSWVVAYVRGLRADLYGDGIEPDSTPEEREIAQIRGFKESCLVYLVLAVIAGLGVWIFLR